MTSYESTIELLNRNHFYPGKEIKVNKDGSEKIIGLYIESVPLLMDDRIERLKSLLGDDYMFHKYTELCHIKIYHT